MATRPKRVDTKRSTRGQQVATKPIATTVTKTSGKPTARSIAYKASNPTQATSSTNITQSETQYYGDFASDIMRMISELPMGPQREKLISAFNQIQSLPADQQKSWYDALYTQAKTATEPKYQQDLTRSKEDFTYGQDSINQEKDFANQNFKRLSENLDFNRLRDKAQDNKILGDVLSRITSDSFITNVAGSGIIARRGQIAREEAARSASEKDIALDQTKTDQQAQFDQYLARQNDALGRNDVLQGREEADLQQGNLYDTQSLFLDLFGNEVADTGEQVRNDITPTPSVVQPTTTPNRLSPNTYKPESLAPAKTKAGQQLQSNTAKRLAARLGNK